MVMCLCRVLKESQVFHGNVWESEVGRENWKHVQHTRW